VVSDAGKFFSPISGELESWVSQLILWKDHAVLTPKPQSNWGDQEDELEVEQEFILLPATPEGLRDLSQRLSGKVYNPPISQDNGLDFSPLPEMLRLRPRRWLERNSPEPEKVVMMLDLLAEYLGKDGFYWFCACAVFPELQWNITLYLGDVLKTEEGKSLLESCSLMNLTRLPWFRYGYIPDWLRVYLIEALTQEQDQSIRIALRNLLDRVNQTSEGGLTLSIATKPLKNQSDKFFSQLTQIFSGRVSENSPLQDYLFLDFMTKPSPLALRVPEKFGGLVSKSQKSGSEKGKINRRRFLEMLGLGIAGFVSVIAGKRAFETRTLQLTKGCETFQFDVLTVNKQGQIISRRPGQAKSFVEQLGNNVTLEMVEIPGNSFTMGSPLGEKSCYDSEQPQRVVNVSAFLMSKFTVTQAQYQQVMGKNPSYFKGEKRPVEQVSWDDAVEFCKRLSQKSGGKYRLPTEAEWEYACRAGTTTPFYFGETITSDLANYNGNYTYASEPKGKYRQETTDVGSFPPNAFGLYDMRGNVWEWCQDTWHENYEGAPTDATAWITEKEDSSRVLRGGS
jgi:formylglycine-generating enzyme required for sulfatase activity